jgi:hypothetical protein
MSSFSHDICMLITGTFDLTIDGHKYEKIDVHIASSDLLAMVRKGGDYRKAHRWGSCYGKTCPSAALKKVGVKHLSCSK